MIKRAILSVSDKTGVVELARRLADKGVTLLSTGGTMKAIAQAHGYAAETKAYKQNPEQYKGHVGDVSMVVRVAVAGRQNAPDLQTVMGILGAERVLARHARCRDSI